MTNNGEVARRLFQKGTVVIDDLKQLVALKKITAEDYAEITGLIYQQSLEEVKSSKIAEMSLICSEKIRFGCDVVLSSGDTEHFSLSEVDQINLTNAMMAVGFGEKTYPYHADDKICKKYTAEDILRIANSAKATIVYHTTYFNHVKQWINREHDITVVQNIEYGTKLPEDLQKSFDDIVNEGVSK